MIINLTRKKCVCRMPVIASNFFLRTRGMIGREFRGFDGMVFNRCNAIHTMFMSIDLDVVFMDRENRVCEICEQLPPWRPVVRSRRAVTVIELPVGTIAGTGTRVGDILDLNAELSREAEAQLQQSEKMINTMGTAISYKSK
ncbi:MAG: DUF192 domain-containing protein [Victivallales bacterium]|nr:DUF192 domain-containing protein [Victivallales bacterium]